MGCAGSTEVAVMPDVQQPPMQLMPARRGAQAAVRMSWLKKFVRQVPRKMATFQVVQTIIKPNTRARFCRYVTLIEELEPNAVGPADCFASHTWGARFWDLVAALAHVFDDDAYVWVDIFAVLQWNKEDGISEALAAEKVADLDFGAVVKASKSLVLVSPHNNAVAKMKWSDRSAARAGRRPIDAQAKLCVPFFRVWCLVELVSALEAKKPVVMLVGAAAEGSKNLRFEPNEKMLANLFDLMDLEEADASVAADRVRILDDIRNGIGIDAGNTFCRGAVMSALKCMSQREVLAAAVGNSTPLTALQGREALSTALRAAAAGGLLGPLDALLARRNELELEAKNENGMTALMLAALGGHTEVVDRLLAVGAAVNARDEHYGTALMRAAYGGHSVAAERLVAAGADVNAEDAYGQTALHIADQERHGAVGHLLRRLGATE